VSTSPFTSTSFKIVACLLFLSAVSHASTTLVSPSNYAVTQGVAFTLNNNGASQFLFNWTDPEGTSWTNIPNPTLVLTLGQTYTFQRISSAHPFAIMNDTAANFITGTDGAFVRTTSDSTTINAAILTPTTDYTAQPGTPGNTISFAQTIETYWYTCTVPSHTGMTGQLSVIAIPEPSVVGLVAMGLTLAALGRRFILRTK
jgi:hypothetical protein